MADGPVPETRQKKTDFLRYCRPADWTTDEAGNVLLFFVDPVGNWNNGYYVIYRRNDRDMFEYTGEVQVGSHIGCWKNEIEFVKEGFILTFDNIQGHSQGRPGQTHWGLCHTKFIKCILFADYKFLKTMYINNGF